MFLFQQWTNGQGGRVVHDWDAGAEAAAGGRDGDWNKRGRGRRRRKVGGDGHGGRQVPAAGPEGLAGDLDR